MSIQINPLGAGQDVGRSCIIITINDKKIMLDCGVHMGFQDMRKYPDFKLIGNNFDKDIDLVLISHFHLDHCGALPYFTEILGYNGPIIMTVPTKAILPYMLEDFRKLMIENRNFQDEPIFSLEQLTNCINKIQTIQLHELREINDIKIKSYYAGHVLGACMFHIEYQGRTVVYTGDFNSSADRHLGAAWIDKCFPDILICESTYATTLRDSKRARETDFLQQVQNTIDNGGKVLIPVFALGRAQELCILLETYWQRMKNMVPIYFAAGMIEKAHFYYKLFANWMNEKIKTSFFINNMFEFKHIQSFDRNLIKSTAPMVLFATPGMLHGGLSMQIFKEWCNDPKNTLIIPGYCVAGTLGNKLLSGSRQLNIDGKDYDIKMKILSMSFSAHADCRGIMQLIRHLEPKNVVFVHGEKHKMIELGKVVKENTNIPVYCPANFENIKFQFNQNIKQNIVFTSDTLNLNKNKLKGYIIKDNFNNHQFIYEQNIFNDLNFALSILKTNNYEFDEFKISQGCCYSINNQNNLQNYINEKIQQKMQDKGNLYFNFLSNIQIQVEDEILMISCKDKQDPKLMECINQEVIQILENI